MFSVPLSITICNGVLCLGMISSSTRWTTVSALLSGTAKASGQPLYQSTKLIVYLLPDKVVGQGPETSRPNFANGRGGASVSCRGGFTFLQVSSLTDYT